MTLQQEQLRLELKPLTPQLLPAVVELDRLCFGKLWSRQAYERELASTNSDLLVLSHRGSQESLDIGQDTTKKDKRTEVDKEILLGLGCMWGILEEAHITILAVHPDYRHQGNGQLLMYALLREAWRRGKSRATLEMGATNIAALSLYQKFGFAVAGRRRSYYQDTGEDALIMWRSGLNHPEFRQTLASWQQQAGDRLAGEGPYSVIDKLKVGDRNLANNEEPVTDSGNPPKGRLCAAQQSSD